MKNKGFTLVEIMIVVAIILLLAAITIPNITRARIQANQASAQGTLKLISSSLENYYALNNAYPLATTSLIGASPPYLSIDYFAGIHNGYTLTSTLATYSYFVAAYPVNANSGSFSYTVSTGGVIQAY